MTDSAVLGTGGPLVSPSVGGGGGPVDSVFGRIGAVAAVAGDYAASQVTNDSVVPGAFVDDALNAITTAIVALQEDSPVGYLTGLRTLYGSVDLIGIETGECRDDTDVRTMIASGPLTANITITGAGGRNVETAEAADTWYYIFIIGDTTAGLDTTEAFLVNENDIGTFALPGAFNVKRRVGMVYNDASSNLRTFTMTGTGRDREVSYAGIARSNLNVFTNLDFATYQTATVTEFVPPTCTFAELYWELDAGGDDYMETRPTGSAVANDQGRRFESGVSSGVKSDNIRQQISTSQQIDWRKNDATGLGVSLYVYGYRDSI